MFKSGFVSVIGLPNVGKSSLVNALVNESVSIVTPKPQTTRKNTLGVLNLENSQIVFVDTPGFVDTTKGLNPVLKAQFEKSFEGVDVVVGAVGPWECFTDKKPWVIEFLQSKKTNKIFVFTQVDRYNLPELKEKLAPKILEWGLASEKVFFTSSQAKFGLFELTQELESLLKEGPEYYPKDEYTTQSVREMASEVVRKYCFELTHQEVPYGLAVLIKKYEQGPTDKIYADILVSKESHKPMLIGKGGSVIREIGIKARTDIEKIVGHKVALMTQVVVKPNWMESNSMLSELGLHE